MKMKLYAIYAAIMLGIITALYMIFGRGRDAVDSKYVKSLKEKRIAMHKEEADKAAAGVEKHHKKAEDILKEPDPTPSSNIDSAIDKWNKR